MDRPLDPSSAPKRGQGSRHGRAVWASRVRAALLASAPAALMIAIVVVIAFAFIGTLAFVGFINFAYMVNAWPTAYLPLWTAPLWTSLFLSVTAYLIGFVVAMGLGFVRAYGGGKTRNPIAAILYAPVTGYVHAIRGTPFLVQLYVVYYVVLDIAPKFSFLGRNVFFWIGLLALALNTIGYQAEVFRGGFQSIGQGQIEAGKAVGLTGVQISFRIRLPQGLRLIVLPLTNEFISLFKASTICSYISVVELFRWAENLQGHPIEAFLMISLYYLIINIPLSRGVTYVERRFRIPGLGAQSEGGSFTLRLLGGQRRSRRSSTSSGDRRPVRTAGLDHSGERRAQVPSGSRRRLVPPRRKEARNRDDDSPVARSFPPAAPAAEGSLSAL